MKHPIIGMTMDVARACGYLSNYKVHPLRVWWNRLRLRLRVFGTPSIKIPPKDLPVIPGGSRQYPAIGPVGPAWTDFVNKVESVLIQSPNEVAEYWRKYDSEHQDPRTPEEIKAESKRLAAVSPWGYGWEAPKPGERALFKSRNPGVSPHVLTEEEKVALGHGVVPSVDLSIGEGLGVPHAASCGVHKGQPCDCSSPHA